MKNRYFFGTVRMAIIRLSVAVVITLLTTVQIVSAQGIGNGHKNAPKRVIDELTSGNTQDVIVVFNDEAIQEEAHALHLTTGYPLHHNRIIEHKATRYAAQKQEILSTIGLHEVLELKHYSHLPMGFIRIHSKGALDRLLAQPGVVGIYENTAERKFLAESLPLIGQPQVAAQGNLGTGTAVAVLDSGVNYTLSAFGSCTSPGEPSNCKVAFAQDFAPSDGKLDDNGHGTNVAGIVLGVAPGTKIIALDVFRSDGFTYTSDQLSAINWVITNKSIYNIVTINMSFGGGSNFSPAINDPRQSSIDALRAVGIIPVAAAGNEGYKNALAAPAAIPGVISVGAVYDSTMGTKNWGDPLRCTDITPFADEVTCFSNSTSFLTMLAPGSQILAAGKTMGGTSQAAPHVAGAVAVLRAAFPNETLDQTVARLTNGVMITDSRNDITKPRLSLPMALGINTSCSYSISETSKSFNSISSSGSVAVTTCAGCPWSAASTSNDSSWITVTSGSSGIGNGTVNYSVSANIDAVSRTGAITVAGQTYTITQSGSVGTLSNILLNSGFEDGPTSWTDSSSSVYPVITAYLNPTTTTNSWYAWFCGYNNCADTLYQDVTIPANAQSAYVQFNYWITTDETSSVTAYDSMEIRIYSPPSATTYKYWTLSNLNATSGYVLSPKYDVSAFKGQTIRLQFSATTDASFVTSFYVDDVTLMVSGSTPDMQAPTVPTGLTATAISTSMINLTWNASTDNIGITAYKLYRNGALLTTLGKVTSYGNTGLVAGTNYSYTVSACDAAGNCSVQSTSASVTTPQAFSDTQPPTMPTGLSATAISTSTINLFWNSSTDNVGVSKYNVYRNGTLWTVLGNINSYSNSGLTPSTTYSYTVSACDAAGNCSAQSSAVSATTYAPFSAQASPIVFSGSSSYQVNGSLVNISIDRITNNSYSGHSGSLRIELWALTAPYFGGSVTGYVTASIRTNLISGGSDTLAANNYFSNITLNLPYTVPPASNSNYALFLLEYDPVGCSIADHFCIVDYVNYHEVQPPTVPTGLSSTAISSSQINLSWNASYDNVGVTTYKVYRNGSLVTVLGNVTSYVDVGRAASTLYSYTVSACDAVGNCSAQSTTASATTQAPPDTQPPSVPTGLTATAVSSTHINLTWNASTDNVGVTSYKIYSGSSLVATLGNVTSSLRTNAPSTTFIYSVSACDAAGNCSARSASASATTPALSDTTAPTVPTGLTATAVSTSQINLSWNASTDNVGVTAYKVNTSDGQTLTLGNVTNYAHTGLRTSTFYSYNVSACDAMGNCSAQSSSASATTSLTTSATKTKIFLGSDDNITISTSGTTLYGNTGNNTVTIVAGTTGVTLDQNIGRINLSGTPGNYKFRQTGNIINIYDTTDNLIVSAPVQGDNDGTVLSFSNGTSLATAKLAGGIMTLGGATLSTTTASALNPNTTTTTPTAVTTTKAKVYLGTDNSFTVGSSGTTVYGNNGNGTVTIVPGVTGVILDQNIKRINFSGTSNNYSFMQTGNMINVYDTYLLVRVPIQGGSNGTLLSFSDGIVSALLTSSVMTLGGKTVSVNTPTTLNLFGSSTTTTSNITTTTAATTTTARPTTTTAAATTTTARSTTTTTAAATTTTTTTVPTTTTTTLPKTNTSQHLWGGTGYTTYLGCLTCSSFDINSICNQFGTYGSAYSTSSIWNQFGTYGSSFSSYSPWNSFSSQAPAIYSSNGLLFYGYFSVNSFMFNRTQNSGYLNVLNYYAATRNLSLTRTYACGN